MKIISARIKEPEQVYDLSVNHEHHSFVHASGVVMHNCGFVIANEPISNFIPTTTISGFRTTQYTAGSVEAVGGLKMDFLGLNSLKDIGAAIKLIQAKYPDRDFESDIKLNGRRVPGFRIVPNPTTGVPMDIWDLPEDQAVFNDIAEGKTETVFQLNTNSAKQWLTQFNYDKSAGVKAIDSIEAISAFTALDRPGPLDAKVKDPITGREHNMLVEYANRAKGLPPSDPIKALDALLPETYGVIVYQEQLQKLYQHLTGCTGIEANTFRTNIAKKKMAKVLEAYPNFIAKASEKIGKEDSEKVWNQIVTFGQYGFNKSHSICYSVTAYACAYLKHYYPNEWWCAVLKNADKKEIAEKFWRYCKQWIDLPDVRYSGDEFEIQGDRIRAPLSFINGVGPTAHAELCAGRPYLSVTDFVEKIVRKKMAGATLRVNEDGTPMLDAKGKQKVKAGLSALNRGVVGKLIVSGVMDSLFPSELRHVNDKLDYYEQEVANVTQALTGKKAKKGKVDKKYVDLNPLTRFQMQKNILPIYTNSVVPILVDMRIDGVTSDGKGNYWYLPSTAESIADMKRQMGIGSDRKLEAVPLVDGAQLRYYNEEFEIYDGQHVACTVAGYIISERRFSYKGGTKSAVEVIFDVDGEQFLFVKWPDRESGHLEAPKDMAGSIAILHLTRYKSNRPFAIDAILVVAPPLSEEPEETSQE